MPLATPNDSAAPSPMGIAREVIVSAGNILVAAGFSRAEIAEFFRQAADQLDPEARGPAQAHPAPPSPPADPADPAGALVAGLAASPAIQAMARLLAQAPAHHPLRDRFDVAMQLIPQIAEAQAWLHAAASDAGLAIAPGEPEGAGSLPLDLFHEACRPAFAHIASVAEVLAAEDDEAALQLILMSLVDNTVAVSRELKDAMERAVARLGSGV